MTSPSDNSGVSEIGLPRAFDLTWPLLVGFLAILVTPWDESLTAAINPLSPIPWLDAWAHFLDKWSTRIELLLLLSLFFLSHLWTKFKTHRKSLCGFVSAWVLCEIVVGTLKRVTHRPRPGHVEGMQDQLRVLFDHIDYKSFPSGHTAFAVTVALFLTVWRPKSLWVPLGWGLAILIGLGRIYIGAHHPSDVLAGAAVGWLLMTVSWKATTPGRGIFAFVYPPKRLAPMIFLVWALVLGWIFHDSISLRDGISGEVLANWHLPKQDWLHVLGEPIFGPARKIASLPDLRNVVLWGGFWLLLLSILAFLKWGSRALKVTASVVAASLIWGFLAISGGAGWQGRPRSDEARTYWAFDAQSHLGDPYDGAVSLEDGLKRFAALGYNMVIPTWHDAWAQGYILKAKAGWEPMEFFGAEWSGGDPADHPLHLLVYNRSATPKNLKTITDYSQLIEAVHQAGGVVVASHFWRGDKGAMPSSEELIAANIDGFEVAGRNEEGSSEALERLSALRGAIAKHNLLALGNSDFHGKRGFNQVWNVVPQDLVAFGPAGLMDVLNSGNQKHRVVSLHSDPMTGIFGPWHALVRYLRELPKKGRVVWLLWVTIAGVLVWRRGISIPSSKTE